MNPDLFTFILVMLACAIFAVMGYKIGYLYGWDKGMKDCSRIWQLAQRFEALQGGKSAETELKDMTKRR